MRKALLAVALGTFTFTTVNAQEFEFTEKDKQAITILSNLWDFQPFVSPKDIIKEYADNEVRANNQFYGKRFYIEGNVAGIKNGFTNEPFLVLDTGDEFSSMTANFNAKSEKKLIDLNKNDRVNLICKGSGSLLGVQTLSDCYFVDDYEPLYKPNDTFSRIVAGKNLTEKDAVVVVSFATMFLPNEYLCQNIIKPSCLLVSSDDTKNNIQKLSEKEKARIMDRLKVFKEKYFDNLEEQIRGK